MGTFLEDAMRRTYPEFHCAPAFFPGKSICRRSAASDPVAEAMTFAGWLAAAR